MFDEQMRKRSAIVQTGSLCDRRYEQNGFSLMELLLVVIIVLIVAGTAIPKLMSALDTAHLRGAATDLASLLEQARIYAIRDNRYYSTYILAGSGNTPQQAYIDMLPKSVTGASGNGGVSIVAATSTSPGDPAIVLRSDVVPEAASGAPNTSNLESQLLPATTPVTPTDTTVTAATFGPRGLPCTPVTLTGGTVCDSSGGATAFWTFLQDSTTSNWQAVTITPAGRIERWYYTGSTWSKL